MKQLVIYFSHVGENYMEHGIEVISKGNTEIVAETIAKLTSADLFKVEPANPYPEKYKECCQQAQKEINADARPVIKKHINDISQYDVIYIGGPVWYGHLPCAIFTAIEKLDFKEKIVKLFCTHEGSGLGSIMNDIKRFCVGAKIEEGLPIRGCKAIESKDKISSWIIK